MSTPIATALPSVLLDESKFLAVANPYPPSADLEFHEDRLTLGLWLVCCAGRGVLRAIFYKPSSSDIVIEVNREFERFHELLGQHVWSEFLVEPTKEHMGKSSTVFYTTFNTGRLVRNGWERVEIEEHWLEGWIDNNSIIKFPYPKSSHWPCNASLSSEAKSGEPMCHLLPQQYFSIPPLPSAPLDGSMESPAATNIGGTAAPIDIVSAGKRGSSSVSPDAPTGISCASSSVGSSNTPITPPSLAPTFSQALDYYDWSASVESTKSKRINSPPASTPPSIFSSHPAPGQLYDPLSPLDPSRVYEYDDVDRPRHSTVAAMMDLFDDGFLASSVKNDTGGTRALSPDGPEYLWNLPADAEPVVSLPSSTRKGKTAAPSDAVSATTIHSKNTRSLSPSFAQPPTHSSVVANKGTKKNPRTRGKGGSPPVSSTAPAGTSCNPSTIGSSNVQSSRVAPPAPPVSFSQTPEHCDWSAEVWRFESEQLNSSSITPSLTHSSYFTPGRLYDPLMIPLELSRVYECDEDQPKHPMVASLFNDGFFTSTTRSDSSGARVPGPDDPDYDPWNAPAESAPSSTINGEPAAPSHAVPLTSASIIDVQPLSPSSTQSPAPSSVVAKRRTRNNTRKRGSPSAPKASADTSGAPSTVGNSNAQSSRAAPPAPQVELSQTPEHFNWGGYVELEPDPIDIPPTTSSTPAPSHSSQRQCYDPHDPLEPSQDYEYDEEDQPRESTGAALMDLFDDGFFTEASPVKNDSGGTRVLGPDNDDYDPWNPPAGTENLWEGYDTPRLEPPTKPKKNGEWMCSQHGSLCSPGICQERGRFERDERMNKERWGLEQEKVQRDIKRTRVRQNKEKTAVAGGGGKGEWRSRPAHLRSNSSSSRSDSDSSSNSGSDSNTTRNQATGSIATLQLDQEDRSIDGIRSNAEGTDTLSMVSSVGREWGPVAGSDDGNHDEGASVAKSRTTNTSRSRAAPPASVSSSVRSKGPSIPATPRISPTSPSPATRQPAWNARSAANHTVLPSLSASSVSRATPLSATPSNMGAGAKFVYTDARSAVSPKGRTGSGPSTNGLLKNNSIQTWLAEVTRECPPPKVADRRQKSRGGRKPRRKNKAQE